VADSLTAFSDKCAEHGYLVQMVKETRTAQMAEIQDARSWRERTTGELYGIKEAISSHMAHHQGVENGRAEVTGEITAKVRDWAKIGKWVLGAIAALAAGGGATEGLRRLLGGG
jgi:hypothetical protein